MKVLLVGDDSRAHIIAEQLARSCEFYSLMSKPNPGIKNLVQKSYICSFDNIEVIGSWVVKEGIELVFIVEEDALVAGLGDALYDAGVMLASPKMAAANLGNNRVYARNILKKAGVPFPEFVVCKNEKEVATAIKDIKNAVIKSSIKTDWKGVRIGDSDFATTKDVLPFCKKLIKAHGSVIVEKKADGEEFSLQAFSDGTRISVAPPVQVAKRLEEGDKGALAEGMGSYSSGRLLPFLRSADFDSAHSVMQKIVDEMKKRGEPLKGMFRANFIATSSGIRLLDIIPTLGNPEAINMLSMLKTQFVEVLYSMAGGNLVTPAFQERCTVVKCVIPDGKAKKKKYPLEIDSRRIWDNGAKIYLDNIEEKGAKWFADSSSDRILSVFASGENVTEAEQRVEVALSGISGGIKWRSDIGKRDYVEREIKRMKIIRGEVF